jgi:hypothetical protein
MKLTSIALIVTALCGSAHADETVWRCNGLIVSNGSCVGSQSNTAPPIVDCTYDTSDSRCRSRGRR